MHNLPHSLHHTYILLLIWVLTFLFLKLAFSQYFSSDPKKLKDVSYIIGHSVGEFTALCAAGCLDPVSISKILQMRGKKMQELCSQSKCNTKNNERIKNFKTFSYRRNACYFR